jgi:hypothetical protein
MAGRPGPGPGPIALLQLVIGGVLAARPVVRSYHQEHRRSHQNSQLKPAWAGLVLGWVTPWESPVTYCFLLVLPACFRAPRAPGAPPRPTPGCRPLCNNARRCCWAQLHAPPHADARRHTPPSSQHSRLLCSCATPGARRPGPAAPATPSFAHATAHATAHPRGPFPGFTQPPHSPSTSHVPSCPATAERSRVARSGGRALQSQMQGALEQSFHSPPRPPLRARPRARAPTPLCQPCSSSLHTWRRLHHGRRAGARDSAPSARPRANARPAPATAPARPRPRHRPFTAKIASRSFTTSSRHSAKRPRAPPFISPISRYSRATRVPPRRGTPRVIYEGGAKASTSVQQKARQGGSSAGLVGW